jgi:hypothetical protein
MFPAISSVVLLYNRLVKNSGCSTTLVVEGDRHSAKMVLFVGCYLAVWALTGLALLLGWSMLLNRGVAATGLSVAIYGSILVQEQMDDDRRMQEPAEDQMSDGGVGM